MAPRLARTDATCRRSRFSARVTAPVIMCLAVLACAEIQKDVPPPIASQQPPPPWAYPIQPPMTPSPDDGVPRRVPGSNLSLTLTQIRDLYAPPDWHPDDHPPIPESSAKAENQKHLPADTVTIRTARDVRRTPASPVLAPAISHSRSPTIRITSEKPQNRR
jgi:hypothetical protein